MGPSLQRLELTYNQPHDRLILILHSQDFNEYLFWITRRAVVVLFGILTQLIQSDKKSHLQHAKEKEHWAEAIEKEQEQKQATAQQFGTRVAKRPLGDEPLLAKIQGAPGQNGTFVLRLEDINGRWIEFGGDSSILMALLQLLQQSSEKADWNLKLQLPV